MMIVVGMSRDLALLQLEHLLNDDGDGRVDSSVTAERVFVRLSPPHLNKHLKTQLLSPLFRAETLNSRSFFLKYLFRDTTEYLTAIDFLGFCVNLNIVIIS